MTGRAWPSSQNSSSRQWRSWPASWLPTLRPNNTTQLSLSAVFAPPLLVFADDGPPIVPASSDHLSISSDAGGGCLAEACRGFWGWGARV